MIINFTHVNKMITHVENHRHMNNLYISKMNVNNTIMNNKMNINNTIMNNPMRTVTRNRLSNNSQQQLSCCGISF